MKNLFTTLTLLVISTLSYGQYQSLDTNNSIIFNGNSIVYQSDTFILNSHAFFIDGQLSTEEANNYPYVYSSINEAIRHLTNGTQESPMRLYIAPYVYWIDNPDDPEIRVPKSGGTPYALEIECDWLSFIGLNKHPENVVLAVNRGQTLGAKGNYTMFKLLGDGIYSENITFGNYCNVDLIYPLKPELERKKRSSTIVQAQLIHCNGDKIIARNTHFISRLNLCPFVGAKRILFEQCHFESTDDALCGTGIYLNSTFEFYSSKPFYTTVGTGAVFLNCNIKSVVHGQQYFTKAPGQVALVDTKIKGEHIEYLSWQAVQPVSMKNYQYNVTLNGATVTVGNKTPKNTIDMKDKRLLNAYRFLYKNQVYYNTYNLLQGDDDWDPMQLKPLIKKAEAFSNIPYSALPVQLIIDASKRTIETAKDSCKLTTTVYRFGKYKTQENDIEWHINPKDSNFVKLIPYNTICTVVPTNESNTPQQVIVVAESPSGLQAACEITVLPKILPAPDFVTTPSLHIKNNTLQLQYELNSAIPDQSEIDWFRSKNKNGTNAIKVAESRYNQPNKEYALSSRDVGYYLKARISPKNQRSEVGSSTTVICTQVIQPRHITTSANTLSTDFKNTAIENQPEILPGFWTFAPFDTLTPSTQNVWTFAQGNNGAINDTGLTQTGRSAQLFYTPTTGQSGNLELHLELAPYKSAGQGFSMAGMYMDIVIAFDAKTKSGYGLRLIRTTEHHNTVACYFVKYRNGETEMISDTQYISCYRTPFNLTIKTSPNTVTASGNTSSDYSKSKYPETVDEMLDLSTTYSPNGKDGFGIIYNGGAKTIIKKLTAIWL